MRIVQLADLHFGAENKQAVRAAADCVRDIDPDVIVVSGDMTQRGKHREFKAARDWVEGLQKPTLIVPGNHDTPLLNPVSRAGSPFYRHDSYFNEYASSLRVANVRIDGLNTARGWQVRTNWAEGSVRVKHLDRIVRSNVQPGTVRVLACHHPFRSPKGAPLRTRTRRGAAASELLAGSDISILLTGHVHTPHAELIREKSGNYLAITAGTLSTRLRVEPAAFNCIDLSAKSVGVDMFRFSSGRFNSQPLGKWKLSDINPD